MAAWRNSGRPEEACPTGRECLGPIGIGPAPARSRAIEYEPTVTAAPSRRAFLLQVGGVVVLSLVGREIPPSRAARPWPVLLPSKAWPVTPAASANGGGAWGSRMAPAGWGPFPGALVVGDAIPIQALASLVGRTRPAARTGAATGNARRMAPAVPRRSYAVTGAAGSARSV
jgi:hypothetical protein